MIKMKTLTSLLVTLALTFMTLTPVQAASPVMVQYSQTQAVCGPLANLPTVLSSGCLWPSIKVTARSANPNAVGLFILVLYKSVASGVFVVQPHFTTERDSFGDFIATFPSGDMSAITISAVEVEPGELVTAIN